MNVVVRHQMSIEEFLAWEAEQELKYEFDGTAPVAMSGGTLNHARIQTNLAIEVGGRLRGGPCEYLGSDMKVVMAETVRYPDGQVVCTRLSGKDTWTTKPTVLFEVLSESSKRTDHTAKAGEYTAVDTVQRYVILEQDKVEATVHTREADGWRVRQLDAAATLDLPEIGIAVPLASLYVDLDLEPRTGAPR